jgi:hypothetical protein
MTHTLQNGPIPRVLPEGFGGLNNRGPATTRTDSTFVFAQVCPTGPFGYTSINKLIIISQETNEYLIGTSLHQRWSLNGHKMIFPQRLSFVFCGFLLLALSNGATAHIQGSNVTQLFLEATSTSFITLRSVQIFNLASAPQYAPAPLSTGPAFLLSSQEALNSSTLRSAGVQIYLEASNSTGPLDIWNLTSFSHDPAAALWSISTYQGTYFSSHSHFSECIQSRDLIFLASGLSDVIVAVSISFNLSSSWDLPDKYLLWGKYSIAGFPPKFDGLPHRWHDPGPAEPVFNSSSQQFDSFSTPDALDLFCSRTPTPGVKIRRTPTSVYMLSRSFGSLKLIRYDAQTMNPLWKRVLVPRVEPLGCAHTATSRFVNMMAVDPNNDDVWVLFTPNSPDAMTAFLQYNSTSYCRFFTSWSALTLILL